MSAAIAKPTSHKVPTIEEVVRNEGFTPTPSLSGIYRPGSVLVPNSMGGHDVVVEDCIGAQHTTQLMAQSSIAASLSSGVSANLSFVKGSASLDIQKRLSFVDPEQRTIALSKIKPTTDCEKDVTNAAKLRSLETAFIIYDVLAAQIKSQVCTKSDASGNAIPLAKAEASSYSDCVQESNAQVSIGYKGIPLSEFIAINSSYEQTSSVPTYQIKSNASFVAPTLGVADMLKRQNCEIEAKEKAETQRQQKINAESDRIRAEVTASWNKMEPELTLCLQLSGEQRAKCAIVAKQFVDYASTLALHSEQGIEIVSTSCGNISVALAGKDWIVSGVKILTTAKNLLDSFTSVQKTAANKSKEGYQTLVSVPAGKYRVGCTDGQRDNCHSDEKPAHDVSLTRTILVGKTEVTQGLYKSVMGHNPSFFKSCGDTCPVEQVSWFDAVEFANKLSVSEGLEPCYVMVRDEVSWPKGTSCLGYRLPTEAEWEVSARGGKDTLYSGGDREQDVSWIYYNGDQSTHPVGTKKANAYGLYDMTGNVQEWVWDYYGSYYDSDMYIDPLGPASRSGRVHRGGGWGNGPRNARVANRNGFPPDYRGNNLGFRIVRTAP